MFKAVARPAQTEKEERRTALPDGWTGTYLQSGKELMTTIFGDDLLPTSKKD